MAEKHHPGFLRHESRVMFFSNKGALLIGFFYVNERIILEYHVYLCHNIIGSVFKMRRQ